MEDRTFLTDMLCYVILTIEPTLKIEQFKLNVLYNNYYNMNITEVVIYTFSSFYMLNVKHLLNL